MVAEPEPGHEQMEGRLSIPYVTRAGVVNIKFRCMEDHSCKEAQHPKYLGLHGQIGKPRLYNVQAFFSSSRIIGITEGELDAFVAHHVARVLPTVGAPGVSTWQPHFARCFNGYDEVVVFADGDKPGREFTRMVCKEIPVARPVYLPDGSDVNTLYLSEGAEGLRQRAGIE